MLGRIVASLLTIGAYETAVLLAKPWLTLSTDRAAGGQFEIGDASFLSVSIHMGLDGKLGALPTIVSMVVLLAIWWRPIARRVTHRTKARPTHCVPGSASVPHGRYYIERPNR